MDNDDEGRRQDGKPYKKGNTRDDGSYEVGRNRPPLSGRFAAGDGRSRGRRSKGARNFDTEFAEESARLVPVNEGGKERRVPKRRAAIIRLYDNAYRKGQNPALDQVMQHNRRIADKATGSPALNMTDREIVDQYLRERAAESAIDPTQYGDPAESGLNSDEETEGMPPSEPGDDQ